MSKAAFHGQDYRMAARAAARKYGLDADVFERQIGAESAFNPNARSPAGALGIAQIMPDTARGWGVNPMNPTQALNAAAKNMARYVEKYGSYRDALVAYNAGPGRVGKPLFAETAAYVSKILNGKSSQVTSTASKGGGATTSTRTTPGQTTTDDSAAVLDSVMAHSSSRGGLLKDVMARLDSGNYTTTTPDQTVTTTAGRAASAASGGSAKGLGPLRELFWQGKGGIDVKNGAKVPQGFVSGHQDHVHVASGPKTVVALGQLAQSMGLHVGENPHFGAVSPTAHTKTSYHYRNGGEAIDVSGDPRKMAHFAATVAHKYGLKVKG